MNKIYRAFAATLWALFPASAAVLAQAPVVVTVSPAQNNPSVQLSANIEVTFDRPIMHVSFYTFVVNSSVSGLCSGAFGYPVDNTVTFNPTADFLPGEVITVTLTTGVESSLGYHMARSYSWSFTAATRPGDKFLLDSTYGVGGHPRSVVCADFDYNGILDLAVADSADNSVAILTGNGNGSFTLSDVYSVNTRPFEIIAADLDGEGGMDLVVAGSASDSVCVLLNDGNKFSLAVKYFCGKIPSSLTVADLEGDGYPDIAVVDNFYKRVWTLRNRGDGTFEAPVYHSVNALGSPPYTIAAGDVDGDGLVDLVTANDWSDNLYILRNDGEGGFSVCSSPGVGSHPQSIGLADLNGDGALDIATADTSSHSVSVLLNQGNCNFSLTSSIAVGGSPNDLKAAALDGDSDLDLIVATGGEGTCVVLVNDSSAGFSLNWLYTCNENPQSVCTGDFNSDGVLDFAIARTDADSLSVYLNRIFPKVESTSPAQHALNVDSASSVSATFSVAMKPASFDIDSVALVLSGSASGFHDGTVAYSVPDTTVTLDDLTTPFHAGEVVTAFLKAGVQSSDGIAADSSFAWSFTVASDPADTLQSRDSLLVGAGPWEIIAADFDRDSLIDIATCNRYSNNVSVCFNGGTGVFDQILTYDVGGYPVSVVAADLNQDGFLDLATANLDSDDISVLLNNRDGTFGNQSVFDLVSGFAPSSLTAAELNGDGHIDLAVAENAFDLVSIMINDGGGNFTRIVDVPVGNGPASVRAGDLDNDGDFDLAVSNGGSSNVTVLWNSGAASFRSQTEALGPGDVRPVSICLADIDQNGWLDIISANKNGDEVAILLNAGAASFSLVGPFSVGRDPQSVAAADMNGDGLLDIVVANEDSYNIEVLDNIMVLLNKGDSSFAPPVAYRVGERPYSVTAADLDNDGDMDLACAEEGWNEATLSDYISILRNRSFTYVEANLPAVNKIGVDVATDITVKFNHELDSSTINNSTIFVAGSFTGARKFTTRFNQACDSAILNPDSDFLAGEAVSVVVTDGVVSSEGYPLDHVTSWSFTTAVADGGGGFKKTTPDLTCGSHPWSVRLADLDGDNDLDAVVANESSDNISVFFNQGSGAFSTGPNYDVGRRPRAVVTVDFTGDGYVDLATANFDDNTVSVLLNDQHGTFAGQITYPLNVGTLAHPTSLMAADLNNDGNIDLATANEGDNSVTILSNNGDGIFSVTGSYSVGTMPGSIEAGDLDSKGYVDLVTANADANSVTVLWNNGGDFSGGRSDYPVLAGGSPRSIVAADLDGDGDLDLAVANENANNVSVLRNLGSHTFSNAGNFSVGRYPSSIDAGDVNGDQNIDLITVDFFGKTVSILLNSGSASFLPRYSEALSSGWPSSVCMGDLDKNSTLDLVATISDAGTMAVLLNVGQAGDSCCIGRVGNANGLGTYPQEVTISDIQTLVTAKFIQGTCNVIVPCVAEGDVNQSGGVRPTCNDITISDIATLVNHLFIAGPANAPLKSCL